MKAPNCVVGPDDTILVPRGSTKTDWEIELCVIVGKRAIPQFAR
jgi:2-keto-4-pentenoate hydratase/2-oxohepta-3-ene-1,7-dioic acid hydratase in catechol pathway